MSSVLNVLHVLLAVFVIGPLVVAPFAARRAIMRRDPDRIRSAANQLALFGIGSVVVAGFGVATVLTGDDWALTTPWVLVAATLFVVALGLTWVYAVPALRAAVGMVAHESPGPASAAGTGASSEDMTAGDAADGTSAGGDQTADLHTGQRLDAIAARITGAGWLLLVTFAAITVLMTTRPS